MKLFNIVRNFLKGKKIYYIAIFFFIFGIVELIINIGEQPVMQLISIFMFRIGFGLGLSALHAAIMRSHHNQILIMEALKIKEKK